jgi:hypothetical protein
MSPLIEISADVNLRDVGHGCEKTWNSISSTEFSKIALTPRFMQVKGYDKPQAKAAEQARVLIEEAKSLGKSPEEPLLWGEIPPGGVHQLSL